MTLTPEEYPETHRVLRSGIAEGVAPGMIAGVWRASAPGRFDLCAVGERRKIPSSQPMEIGTLVDFASVSKVLATATLAGRLVDRGWLRWDTPLTSILPVAHFRGIEIRHLLSHTAGLTWWEPYWEKLRAHFAPTPIWQVSVGDRQRVMREIVCARAPDLAPGERAIYSDPSFLLLGFALEEVTRMPLDRAVRELVWEPMGLRSFRYLHVRADVNGGRIESASATEDCPWRGGVVQGQVHDDNAWAMGGYSGHSGVFGTAEDVLVFARALVAGDFLSRATLRAQWTPVSEPAGCSRTLGWDTPSGPTPSASTLFSPRSVGHLGFTGTSLWIDTEANIAVTLLTNRVHPSRDNEKIRAFRPLFHAAIRKDLEITARPARS